VKLKLIGLGIIFLLISCKTYTITLKFQSQFTTCNKMKEVETNNPLFYKNFKYLSNDIKYLNATDKRKSSFVQNSPSLEMR
jgi:hypothetical protein